MMRSVIRNVVHQKKAPATNGGVGAFGRGRFVSTSTPPKKSSVTLDSGAIDHGASKPFGHPEATGWRNPNYSTPLAFSLFFLLATPAMYINAWKASNKHADKNARAALPEEEKKEAIAEMVRGSSIRGDLVKARRESLQTYKEMYWQQEDPKREYTGQRWKQFNEMGTGLKRTKSLNPNAKNRSSSDLSAVLEE